jgi:hypothetical protein
MSKLTNMTEDKDFSEHLLRECLIDKDNFDFGMVLRYIQLDANILLEDIYDNGELDDWAETNGYVKEE